MAFRSKRALWIAGAAILLALFLVRPGASRLKARIATSIGIALQRQVDIGTVELRVLPRPGFDLGNFVVHDDPAFSAEPVLQAQEVIAALRLSSLLRGRIEISRLSLTEPSLNLTRGADGRWNIEKLLERTAQTTVAPTGKPPSISRPAFPYIEADRGRINFKFGAEKKPFTLTEADYALWQDSENTWGVRLKARPTRTDLNLSDTGQFKLTGTWQRAANLHDTPLQFNLQWEGGQLGQVTKLFSGHDMGWRGAVAISAALSGTPGNLVVRSDASLADFRRYDILGGGLLTLRAHCDAHYDSTDRGLRRLLCQAPVSDGAIALQGEILNLPGPRTYELNLVAERVPSQSLLTLLRHVKKDMPDDLQADGTTEAEFDLRTGTAAPGAVEMIGNGEATNLRFRSTTTKTDLAVETVSFSLNDNRTASAKKHRSEQALDVAQGPRLAVGPILLKLGRPTPVTARAWLSRSGYGIAVDGEADLRKLLQTARTFGIPTARPAAEGWAKLALQIGGLWSGFTGPETTGTAQLHNLRTEVRGLNEPLEITTVNLDLAPDKVTADGISGQAAGARWNGSLSFPRLCPSIQLCPVEFDLHADELSTDKINEWLGSDPPKRRWYGFLSAEAQGTSSFLSRVHASGKLSVNKVEIRALVGSHVTASAELDHGKLRLADLRGDVLGGKHRGEWQADFTSKTPQYSGTGAFENISLVQLAELMHENWIVGTASAKYKVETAGRSAADLSQSAKGAIDFNMRDGSLPRILLAGSPLKVRRFAGSLMLHDGQVEIQDAALDSNTTAFVVSGAVSANRKLDFKLIQDGSPRISVAGTLGEPRVSSARRAETRAALKP